MLPSRARRPGLGSLLGVSSAALAAWVMLGEAEAQAAPLGYDIGIGIGPSKRFLNDKPGGDASFGGVAMLHADLNVLPLLRLGAYAGFELSPAIDGFPREMFPFGVEGKLTIPIDSPRWRLYALGGFGYDAVYTKSFQDQAPTESTSALVPALYAGEGGGFFEVPIGLGLTYKLRDPWQLFFELRGTFGFGFSGSLYNLDSGRGVTPVGTGGTLVAESNPGEDLFGLSLVVGVQFDK